MQQEQSLTLSSRPYLGQAIDTIEGRDAAGKDLTLDSGPVLRMLRLARRRWENSALQAAISRETRQAAG